MLGYNHIHTHPHLYVTGQTVVEALDMLGPESSFRLEPLESSMYITPKAAMYNFRGGDQEDPLSGMGSAEGGAGAFAI